MTSLTERGFAVDASPTGERDAVIQALAALAPEARAALVLQHVEGFSLAEIADIVGRTPKATESLESRFCYSAMASDLDAAFLEGLRNGRDEIALGRVGSSEVAEPACVTVRFRATRHDDSVRTADPAAPRRWRDALRADPRSPIRGDLAQQSFSRLGDSRDGDDFAVEIAEEVRLGPGSHQSR